MTKAKKIILLLICFLTLVFSLLTAVVSFAYFSKKEIYDGYFSGEVELLFDRLNDQGITAYQAHLDEVYKGPDKTVTASATADWGTEAYPYVISDVRHLYNLSELQRLGFFYKKFIDNQNPETPFSIPYFLVCTPAYTPALIDGTNFKGITSIGTDEFPFIGSVCGVKVKSEESETQKITVGGKLCDTSAISNIKVSGNPANADVGLFGYVGYLGDEKKTEAFTGQISTLSNLVLTDVQVTVKSSLWDKVTAFLEDIAENIANNTPGGHRYSFTELHNTADYDKVPHENHHVGILAGHADYAKIEYISVYYSADNIVAIDLKDETKLDDKNKTEANYLSATGILGFIYNINPTFTNNADGSQTITPGSGDSVGDLSYGTVGGGGSLSGMKSGYVLAAEMYKNYHWVKGADGSTTEDTSGKIYLKDAVDKDGNALCVEWIRDRLLWGTEATGRYYFYDGVFTFALSSQQDVIEPTWNNEDGKADEFSIGSTDHSGWKANTKKGNNFVVAFVNEIKSLEKLQDVANNKQPIYIGYEQGETIYMMSLTKSEGSSSIFDAFSDNAYRTIAFNKKFLNNQESILSIQETLKEIYKNDSNDSRLPYDKDGNVNFNIIENIMDYQLISLGSSANLEELKNQYTINVSTNTNGSYSFKNGESVLALLCQRLGWRVAISYTYSIWAGTDKPSNSYPYRYYWSTEASLEYDEISECFTIKFDVSPDDQSATRYVSFNGNESDPKFQGTKNIEDYIKLKFYTVEGTSDLDYGRITFDPIDDPSSETDCYTFKADETVLLAKSTHTTVVDRNNNNIIGTTTTTYEVKSLEKLGWNNGSSVPVSSADLQKKFKMLKGITFGGSLNIFNGTLGSDGIITAPVGSNGTEANIPQSCIAFRINKKAKDIKIRVIVSVAVSEYYKGEEGYDLDDKTNGAYTRYFNLWKMEAAGESFVQVFNATGKDLLDRFEVPRSHPYEPGTTAASPSSEYITVKFESNDYRCYLNGDRVLVAYEFTVDSTSTGTGVGVYCLGMSGIDSSGNTISDVPMEIVYFSAEGVASAGRDGASGSQIGTIDFVYDYKDVIVTVTESSKTDSNGEEDYSTYYPSYCLLYFDIAQKKDSSTEAYYSVNDEVVIIRRYVYAGTGTPGSDANHNTTPSKTILFLKSNGVHSGGKEDDPGGISYTCIVQYSTFADNVNVGTKEQE